MSNENFQTPPQENLVLLSGYRNITEAYIVKSFLENHNIKVYIYDEHTIGVDWFYSDALGGVKIVVPVEHADRARELLLKVDQKYLLDKKSSGDANQSIIMDGPECPKCGSLSTAWISDIKRRGFRLILLNFAVPVPFLNKNSWLCKSCGHRWQTASNSSGFFVFVSWLVFVVILGFIIRLLIFLIL